MQAREAARALPPGRWPGGRSAARRRRAWGRDADHRRHPAGPGSRRRRGSTRPTGDRVREAAFNLIGPVDDARVLDLFAGSGALGLEALSRGAASVTFVESDRAACRTIAENLAKLKLTGARVVCGDAVWTCGGSRARTTWSSSTRPTRPGASSSRGSRSTCRGCSPRTGCSSSRRAAHRAPAAATNPHFAAVRFRAAHPLRALP